MIKPVIEAMAFCHEKNIVHRDLKPENIVFDTPNVDKKLVIIDFGEAIIVDDEAVYDEFVGSIWYFAPEIVRERKGWELKKSDMWSIGIITYVLVTVKFHLMGKHVKKH